MLKTFPTLLLVAATLGMVGCADSDQTGMQANPPSARIEGPESVPMDLFRAVVGNRFGTGGLSRLIVGGVPESLPLLHEVPGFAVLGSLADSTGRRGILVFASAMEPSETLTEYSEALMAAGWTRPTSGVPGRFNASPDETVGALCLGVGSSVFLTATADADTGSLLRADWMAEATRPSQCQASAERDAPALFSIPIPSMSPPAGSRTAEVISQGGRRSVLTSTLLDSRLSPEEIANHYSALLEADGWQPDGSAETDGGSLRLLSHPGAGAGALDASIQVAQIADGERSLVTLTVTDRSAAMR